MIELANQSIFWSDMQTGSVSKTGTFSLSSLTKKHVLLIVQSLKTKHAVVQSLKKKHVDVHSN